MFAQRLDDEPWLLLAWCGHQREALLERLRGVSAKGSARSPAAEQSDAEKLLPSWWPQGLQGLQSESSTRVHLPETSVPEPPARVLERLGPLMLPDAPAGLQQRVVGFHEAMARGGGPDAAAEEGGPGER